MKMSGAYLVAEFPFVFTRIKFIKNIVLGENLREGNK